MALAESFVFCLGTYFGIGVIVAVMFLIFGVAKIDASAKGASPLFRPAIFLGCVALWPFMILRWLSGKKINQPAEEKQ